MKRLRIRAARVEVEVALEDTPTAAALVAAAPFASVARTWGEELYFEAPVVVDREPEARQCVAPGTACFWVEGSAVALPWGRTPLSGPDGRPRLAAACNVIGRVLGEPRRLAAVKAGERLAVSVD